MNKGKPFFKKPWPPGKGKTRRVYMFRASSLHEARLEILLSYFTKINIVLQSKEKTKLNIIKEKISSITSIQKVPSGILIMTFTPQVLHNMRERVPIISQAKVKAYTRLLIWINAVIDDVSSILQNNDYKQ